MLEPTDEMIYAFVGEPEITATDAHAIQVGLAAVLAIVERDNQVHPLCTATLGTDMRCEFEAGMAHPNEHSAKAPSGSRVRWS